MQYTIPALVASSIFALSACSNSSKDPDPTEPSDDSSSKITSLLDSVGSFNNTDKLGWLMVFAEEEQVSFFGTFFEIDGQNPQNNAIAELLSVQGDTCEVEEFSIDTPLLEDRLLNEYTSVSAGEVLTLTSAAGSYGEMGRLEIQGGIGYISLDALPSPSPETLVASVPGDVFSAASVSIEKPQIVEGLTLAEAQVVPMGTAIQWTASESNDTLVTSNFDVQGNEDIFVTCTMVDDGEFIVPNTVFTDASTILGSDAQLVFSGVSRQRAAATRVGSDLFIAVNSVYRN